MELASQPTAHSHCCRTSPIFTASPAPARTHRVSLHTGLLRPPPKPNCLQGTSTPLHTDVLRSHSWSANVAGRKLWRLLPPRHSHLLLDRQGRGPAWDFFADEAEGE